MKKLFNSFPGLELSGRTLWSAVYGDPVEHSLSPRMHNAAYRALGMERAYAAFRVIPSRLPDALRAIPALGLLGVNLTVPHKQAAVALMKTLSAEATLLGAVNCVVNRRSGLFGDNTDARGLEMALRELDVPLRGKRALIIGAGGGAAAAVLACVRLGVRSAMIANRTAERARRLADRFAKFRRGVGKIEWRGLEALRDPHAMSEMAIVINATPVGLTSPRFVPLDYASTRPDCFFYDLIYSSATTAFLRPAVRLGRRSGDGATMLLHQAGLAFRQFNRVKPPMRAMRDALMAALARD